MSSRLSRRAAIAVRGAVAALVFAACSDSASGPTTGGLDVTITGLPATATSVVTVTGPAKSNYSRTLAGSETLEGLPPGTYTIAATNVTDAGARYSATPATQSITVAASKTPKAAHVAYALSSGALAVTINGAPAGAVPQVTVSGPNGYTRLLTASETLVGLDPGPYNVSAADVAANGGTYSASASSTPILVPTSLTPVAATVTYAISTGAIALTVNGLPNGAAGSVSITGPGGFTRQVSASTVVANLAPGNYTITTASVTALGGHVYTASQATQTISVTASETAQPATATYALASGGLALTIAGLPAGAAAQVTITGPGGFASTATGSTTIVGLTPGSYTIAAGNVVAGGSNYAPGPSSQTIAVAASLTPAAATVTYTVVAGPPPPSLNLTIDGLYIVQASQTYAGGVPLIAGRDGLLRVFVKATTANTAQPAVRVRLYQSGAVVNTFTITAPTTSAPTTVAQEPLSASWNVTIPGSFIQPGLAILADVDPASTIPEGNESDNAFPASGTPLALTVRTVNTFNVQFVPVLQSSTGLQGNVTDANKVQFLSFAQRVLPVKDINAVVHAPFTTSTPALDANDGNSAWTTILSEMNALRIAEGSQNYYFGIVKATYNSGVAGYGYVPGRAAVGWDYLPSGSQVTAHELGHNLSRFHAPCGGAGAPDPGFPYTNGTIGVYGYDFATGLLKLPSTSDLMGYCGFGWISDYNFVAMMNYRSGSPNLSIAPAGLSATRRSLVVWGRIDDGKLVLEPAFTTDTRPTLPERAGRYRIEGRDAAQRVLFSYSFDGEEVADVRGHASRHFAFALPLDAATEDAIAELRLAADDGREVHRSTAGRFRAATGAATVTRGAAGAMTLRVADPRIHLAVVRDRRTGQIIALGRGASTAFAAADVDVELSDGLRTIDRRSFARVR